MKARSISVTTLISIIVLGFGFAGAGHAQEMSGGHLYVRAGLGPGITMETEVQEFFGPVSGTEVEFDAGIRFEAVVGFEFTDWLAAEFETGFIFNEADSVTGTTDADFTVANVPLLANLVVQCPATYPVIPFLGGGFGFSASTIDIDSFTLNGITVSGSESDIVLAYQGFAGIRYQFNEQMSLSLAYKYFGSGEPDWEAEIGPPGRIGFGRVETHSVLASFAFRF